MFADLHCDTITTAMNLKKSLFENDLQIDIKRLSRFKSPIQVFSIWLDKNNIQQPFRNTIKAINFFNKQVNEYYKYIDKAFSYDDILENIANNKITAILAIEGGEAIEGNIENLKIFYNMGVRILTLTWNRQNELGYGIMAEENNGLTDFGKKVINEMEALNMIIDVSHINERGFWDVHEITKKPFIASHSNACSVCNAKRNLNDEQIKAIAKKSGLIGINMYPFFVSGSENACIKDVIKHIDYILSLVGDDYVALGCDFDGTDNVSVLGMNDVLCFENLYNELKILYGENTSQKIVYGNCLNLFKTLL